MDKGRDMTMDTVSDESISNELFSFPGSTTAEESKVSATVMDSNVSY